ncbi:MAG: sigma-54-dependent Fis family transcriptional regulator, partial [Acidobacteriota bacterium]
DIGELVFYHMSRLCENYGLEAKGFSPDFLEALSAYDWPGNVRELLGILDRTLSLARHEPILFARHLPTQIRTHLARSTVARNLLRKFEKPEKTPRAVRRSGDPADDPPVALPCFRDYRHAVMEEAEKRYFKDLMEATKGCIKDACAVAGLGRTQLYILLKKHGISRLGW